MRRCLRCPALATSPRLAVRCRDSRLRNVSSRPPGSLRGPGRHSLPPAETAASGVGRRAVSSLPAMSRPFLVVSGTVEEQSRGSPGRFAATMIGGVFQFFGSNVIS